MKYIIVIILMTMSTATGYTQITGTDLDYCSGSASFLNTTAICSANGSLIGNQNATGQIEVTIANLSLPGCQNNQNTCTGNSNPYVMICSPDGTNCIAITTNGTYTNINWAGEVRICLVNCCPSSTSTFDFTWDTYDSMGNSVCCNFNSDCPSNKDCIKGFCIEPPICANCLDACGTCGFPAGYAPTIQEVVDSCDAYDFNPIITTGQTATRCHQFEPTGTQADFRIAVLATCSTGGNVTNFSWTLQEASCGGVLSTGTDVQPTLTGLSPGTIYTFCYTFTVSSNCTSHSSHYPYFIGAQTVVLPVELISFTGNKLNDINEIWWSTASEKNNDYFILEHSTDGKQWNIIDKINGSGNSSSEIIYNTLHRNIEPTINYYRLKQVDFDGTITNHGIISIDNRENALLIKRVNITGQKVSESYHGIVFEYYSDGTVKQVYQK